MTIFPLNFLTIFPLNNLTIFPLNVLSNNVLYRNAGGKKFFINLCVLDEIPPPTPITEQELERYGRA